MARQKIVMLAGVIVVFMSAAQSQAALTMSVSEPSLTLSLPLSSSGVNVHQFDPALGTLTGVTITNSFSGQFGAGDIAVGDTKNPTPAGLTLQPMVTAGMKYSLPGATNTFFAVYTLPSPIAVPTGSTAAIFLIPAQQASSLDFTDVVPVGQFSQYIGAATVLDTISRTADVATFNPNMPYGGSIFYAPRPPATITDHVTITYSYDPVGVATPEPASLVIWGFIVSGGAAGAYVRRRRAAQRGC